MKNKKGNLIVLCVALAVSVLALGILGYKFYTYTQPGYTIREGVYIEGIDIGGMSNEEAKEAVTEHLRSLGSAQITLIGAEGGARQVTAKELGMFWANKEVISEAAAYGRSGSVFERYKERRSLEKENKVYETKVAFDSENIEKIMAEEAAVYDREAVDATLERKNGEFLITEGQVGYLVDQKASAEGIYKYLSGQWKGENAELKLVITEQQPQGSREELSQVKDILGTYTTTFHSSNEERVANVSNGARLINGTLLYPGEEFSAYDKFKPFTMENGYRMAGSFLNGMLVDSIGGGVCQVSTTLYDAVIRAELEITERHNHGLTVGYVPLAADAAIAESSGWDLRFVNNKEYPIYIEGYVTPDKAITFTVYGKEERPANRKISFESQLVETMNTPEQKIITTKAQPVGFAEIQNEKTGYKAQLWKIVTVDGVQKDRVLMNTSTYRNVPRTITVGVATDNQDAYNQIQEAIATGSIDHVKAVADAWAAHNAAMAAQAAAPSAEEAAP